MSASEAQVARLRAEIVNSKELPTIPVLLVRIIEVVDGERTSAKDLVAVIEHDQSLTARVLRLANSSFFATSRDVPTSTRSSRPGVRSC